MHSNIYHCRSQLLLQFLFITILLACIGALGVHSTGGDDDKPYGISTVAGTGIGDLKVNVPALEATFGGINGIAQSKNGDLYVSTGKHVVLKFEFNKQEGTWSDVTIIAGTGSESKGADNVLGTQSALATPIGLSLIEDGSTGEVTAILIADANNQRIRKLDMSSRIITTIAGGTGGSGFSGDGSSAKDAKLSIPRHVYHDQLTGDIYIADTGNNRIRRVRDGIITTVVGKTCTGSDGLGDGGPATGACLNRPYVFTMNAAGEWFIVDYNPQLIRKVDSNSIITTVAGGGTETGDAPATNVQLNQPLSIAFTSSGELLVADYGKKVIRKMDQSGFMKVIAGGGSEAPSSENPIPAKSAFIKPGAVGAYARDGSDIIFIGDVGGYVFMLSNRTTCYGVWSDNSAVCSGHGSCTGLDECKCEDGWTGHDCSMTHCFDIASNETSVCSGHGSCIGVDECQCNSEWMGADCSITHCFGFTSNHPDVCSGKGKCDKPDECHCNMGHRGHYCQRT